MKPIEQRMRDQLAALQPTQIEIIDDSHHHAGHAGAGGGGHYRLSVVSPLFVGKSTMARHRMVYSALHDMMQHDIHALNISAKTPNESQP